MVVPNLRGLATLRQGAPTSGNAEVKRPHGAVPLGVDGSSTPLPELNEDTWFHIAESVIDSEDHCAELGRLCQWLPVSKQVCGANGALYELANQRFGWYGIHKNWNAVNAHYETHKIQPGVERRADSPKEYFVSACRALELVRKGDMAVTAIIQKYGPHPYETALLKARMKISPRDLQSVAFTHQFYREIATAALQVKLSHALQYVPVNREDYGDLARISVTANDYTLRYVRPKTRADFGDLAMIAMRQRTGGMALEDVPTDNPMYGTIAEAGVKTWFAALRWVPKDREVFPPNVSYYTIAKAAVTASGMALEHVPTDRPYYAELALIAVPQMSWVIRDVPSDIPEYPQIALSAVRANIAALQHVPYSMREFLRASVADRPGLPRTR